jgi:hypothetical protein
MVDKQYGILDVAKDFATGNLQTAPAALRQSRLDLCNVCPDLSPVRVCKKCGCFVDAKTALIQTKCPVGKW